MTENKVINKIQKKERHTGFELLRTISMVMIIMMHAIGHGGLGSSAEIGTVGYELYWFLFALGRVSVNCFVMLTGYYMVSSKIRFSRLFKIDCQVIFYSVLTYFIAYAFNYVSLSPMELIKVFTPITSDGYWFATAYFLLYLCIPLLNKVINNIDQKTHFGILIVMFIIFSVWPTVFYWSESSFVNGGYSYIWFIVLYFFAAYIRLYGINLKNKYCLLLYFGLAFVGSFARTAAVFIQNKIHATTLVDNVMDYKMPITLVMSVAFFLIFKNIEIKNNIFKKIILKVAPFSFGVYLLHDSDYIRKLVWDTVKVTRFNSVILSVLYMFAAIIVIALIGYAVDFLYQKLYLLLHINAVEKKIDLLTLKFKEKQFKFLNKESEFTTPK